MKSLIDKYNLAPHPEGGYFREIYRSDLIVDSDLAKAPRNAATHIYFLLTRGQVSRFHRVVHDEIWHFYDGDSLTLYLFNGTGIEKQNIGPGKQFMAVVPAGTWQAAETTGSHTLVGCTVAPGFDFTDFSFLSDMPQDLNIFRSLQTGLDRFL